MARKERSDCPFCSNRWMIDIDFTEEYACWRLHGCKLPKKEKFAGKTDEPCKDFCDFTK